MKKIFLFSFLIFVIQCSHSSGEEVRRGNLSVITHPTAQNIPTEEEAADVLRMETGNLTPEFTHVKNVLAEIELQFVLGENVSNKEEVFNRVEDIAVDAKGRFYVLDTRRFSVGMFNSDGEFITAIGRKGEGPGEFMRPQSMAIYGDSLLFVSDQDRVEVFDIINDGKFVETLPLERMSGSICIAGDQLFAHSSFIPEGYESGDEFNHIDSYSIKPFKHNHSFGVGYKHEIGVAERLSRGQISCNESTSTVQFVFEFFPVIQGYDVRSGELLWTSRIEDFHPPKITEDMVGGRSRLSYGPGEDGTTDQLLSPVNWNDELQLLQILRSKRDNFGEPYIEHHTFVMNSQTGKGAYLGDEFPELATISNGLVASRDYSSLIPKIRFYKTNMLSKMKMP